MCGRFSVATPSEVDLRARFFALGESVVVRRRFNVAPGDAVLAITTTRESEPRGEELRWGLVPHWAQAPATGLKMINARRDRRREAGLPRCPAHAALPDHRRRLL